MQHVAKQYPVSSTSSFLKFVIGFSTFIAISFGVTIGVSKYMTPSPTTQQQATASLAQMLDK